MGTNTFSGVTTASCPVTKKRGKNSSNIVKIGNISFNKLHAFKRGVRKKSWRWHELFSNKRNQQENSLRWHCFFKSKIVCWLSWKILKIAFKGTYRNDPKFSDRQVGANRGAVWSGSTLFAIPSASFGLITLWQSHIVKILKWLQQIFWVSEYLGNLR